MHIIMNMKMFAYAFVKYAFLNRCYIKCAVIAVAMCVRSLMSL